MRSNQSKNQLLKHKCKQQEEKCVWHAVYTPFLLIVYKKTDEWYIEWQQMTTSDNEWYNEWQRRTKSDNEWQWMTASDRSGTVNENGTVHFKEWMAAIIPMTKRDHYYFKGWMAAIRVVK